MRFKKQVPFLLFILAVLTVIFTGWVVSLQADGNGDSDSLVFLPTILNPAATETPTPVPSPTPADDPEWLDYLNSYRTASGLGSLAEVAEWSEGGWLHGRYMVKNDVITHSEDPGNEWYTPEGDAAADHGNIYVSASSSATYEQAINWWLRAPFHAVALLDPELQRTGFGIYNETAVATSGFDWQMGATIDVERGRDGLPNGTTFPFYYPADGGTTPFTQYGGNEYPDPLTSCTGYTTPVGLPLIVQLGAGSSVINVTNSRLQQDGNDVDHCVFDETNYFNPDGNAQSTGRIILDNRDAIVIVPRDPLQAGSTYTVEITNDGTTYSWQFSVDASQKSEPIGHGSARP